MTTVELFLLTKNLLWMLVCIPIHGIFWLVCKTMRDSSTCCSLGVEPRPGLLGNVRFGRRTATARCAFDLPNRTGRRRWLWGETLQRQ